MFCDERECKSIYTSEGSVVSVLDGVIIARLTRSRKIHITVQSSNPVDLLPTNRFVRVKGSISGILSWLSDPSESNHRDWNLICLL